MPAQYLPTVAWETIVRDVVVVDATHYYVSVYPENPNDPGSDLLSATIGQYLKDWIGHTYKIVEVNVGGVPLRLRVEDSFLTGVGPQQGLTGIVYQSPSGSPFLAPIRHFRLDESALDYSRAIELDVQWNHRGIYGIGTGIDEVNLTKITLGAGLKFSDLLSTGWNGGKSVTIGVDDHNNLPGLQGIGPDLFHLMYEQYRGVSAGSGGYLPRYNVAGWLENSKFTDDGTTPKYNANTVWHAGNDGSGSGLDADLFHGLNLVDAGNNWGGITQIGNDGVMEVGKYLYFHETDTATNDYDARLYSNGGVPYWNGQQIWNSGNDGHNSGLDSDMIDGYHISSIMASKRLLVNNENLDNIKEIGSYVNHTGNGTGNSNFPNIYGIIDVIGDGSNFGSIQRNYNADNGELSHRFNWGGWQPWRKVWDDKNSNLSTVDWTAKLMNAASNAGYGGYVSTGDYGGTGSASYHPSGIWANGAGNWLYGINNYNDTQQAMNGKWSLTNDGNFTTNGLIKAYRYATATNLPAITMDKQGSYAYGIGPDGTNMRIRYGTAALDGSSWNTTGNAGIEHFFDGKFILNGTATLGTLAGYLKGTAGVVGAVSSIPESDISFTDVTTGNASTTKHGYLPKLPNASNQFLNGIGGWTTIDVNTGYPTYNVNSWATFIAAVSACNIAGGGRIQAGSSNIYIPTTTYTPLILTNIYIVGGVFRTQGFPILVKTVSSFESTSFYYDSGTPCGHVEVIPDAGQGGIVTFNNCVFSAITPTSLYDTTQYHVYINSTNQYAFALYFNGCRTSTTTPVEFAGIRVKTLAVRDLYISVKGFGLPIYGTNGGTTTSPQTLTVYGTQPTEYTTLSLDSTCSYTTPFVDLPYQYFSAGTARISSIDTDVTVTKSLTVSGTSFITRPTTTLTFSESGKWSDFSSIVVNGRREGKTNVIFMTFYSANSSSGTDRILGYITNYVSPGYQVMINVNTPSGLSENATGYIETNGCIVLRIGKGGFTYNAQATWITA